MGSLTEWEKALEIDLDFKGFFLKPDDLLNPDVMFGDRALTDDQT